jgi:hypothetical protein
VTREPSPMDESPHPDDDPGSRVLVVPRWRCEECNARFDEGDDAAEPLDVLIDRLDSGRPLHRFHRCSSKLTGHARYAGYREARG